MTELEKFVAAKNRARENAAMAEEQSAAYRAACESNQAAFREKFDQLSEELYALAEKVKAPLSRACALYPNLLKVSGDRLLASGRRVEPMDYGTEDCVAVCLEAKKKLLGGLQQLFADDASRHAAAARTVAEGYNTVAAVLEDCDDLAEAATARANRMAAGKKTAAPKSAIAYDRDAVLRESRALARGVLLGGEPTYASEYPRTLRLPYAYRVEDSEGVAVMTALTEWDLAESSVLCLSAEEGAVITAERMAENVSLMLASRYPTSAVKLLVCNPRRSDGLITFFGTLKKQDQLSSLFYNPTASSACEANSQGIARSLASLRETLTTRLQKLGESGSLLDYNHRHPDSPEPVILAILGGYGAGHDAYRSAREDISYLMRSGRRGGIYLVLIAEDGARRGDGYDREPAPAVCPDLTLCEIKKPGRGVCCRIDGHPHACELRANSFSLERFAASLAAHLKKGKRALPLKSILTDKIDTSDFSKELCIPIGRSGNDTVSLRLVTNDMGAHVAIAGRSGSGKSSLLQSIILGGASRYSPEELQFWILDFKDGNGLNQFLPLKHVRFVSLRNRATDALEIVEYITKEQQRRAGLITAAKMNDIAGYNKKMREQGGELMPRLIIVVDEFVVMPKACLDPLKTVAIQGRNQGIGLIISAQRLRRGDIHDDIIAQMKHRFEFANDGIGRLLASEEGNAVTDADRAYVNSGEVGRCLYQNNSILQMRVSWAGEREAQDAFVAELNEKWRRFPTDPPLITGDPSRILRRASAARVDPKQAKELYRARKKQLYVPLGKTRLGAEYRYCINSRNPVLYLCGDDARCASVEYSILSSVLALRERADNVYYFDLSASADDERDESVMIGARRGRAAGIRFARSRRPREAIALLKELYEILKARKALLAEESSVGEPIEILIHCTENLFELFTEYEESDEAAGEFDDGGITRGAAPSLDGEDDDAFLRSLSVPKPRAKGGRAAPKKTPEVLFRELLRDGKNCRMNFVLHFEDASAFERFPEKPSRGCRDILVLPPLLSEYDTERDISVRDITGWLRYAEQIEIARNIEDAYTGSAMTPKDLIPATMVDDDNLVKFIPYEWKGDGSCQNG